MDDERILAIRDKVFKEFALAEDNFESAGLLFESEKYRTSIPLFKDSILSGIKALLRLSIDHLPEETPLLDVYNQSEISKKIKFDFRINEILKKLNNLYQNTINNPLEMTEEDKKVLNKCYHQIEDFLASTRKFIRRSLLTTKEVKKKNFIRRFAFITLAVLIVGIISAKAIQYITTLNNGLRGSYFADPKYKKLIKTRIDKEINFNWGQEDIINNYSDNVYIKWRGQIKAPKSGRYEFITKNDDGVRLWIDDKLIINDWKPHPEEEHSAKIRLEKGYHKIKIEYFEATIFASIKLMWKIPGTDKRKVISSSYLKH